MLKNDDFVPKIRVDTAENELRKEWCVVESLWLRAEQARRKETEGNLGTRNFKHRVDDKSQLGGAD